MLTLLLLAFVVLGAGNAMFSITAGRREELALLHRTGMTTRQLRAMVRREAWLTALAAWLIGSAAIAPGVLGMSLGLLGPTLPVVDLPGYLALSATVLALTVGTTSFGVRRALRTRPRSTD